jgi:hypothetical protein
MEADFPAAHSMDALWFAVDGAGHVALFVSGPIGHAPEGVPERSGDDILDRMWQWRYPQEGGEPVYTPGRRDRDYPGGVATRLGLFYYGYDRAFDPLGTYRREGEPAAPLHVDQLPAGLREHCKRYRFHREDYARAPLVQPLEYGPCSFRYRDVRVAYLGSDGETVRPLPGREREFPAFCEQYRQEYPGRAMWLTFEGPEPPQGGKEERREDGD